jgi:hypothetical protein
MRKKDCGNTPDSDSKKGLGQKFRSLVPRVTLALGLQENKHGVATGSVQPTQNIGDNQRNRDENLGIETFNSQVPSTIGVRREGKHSIYAQKII